MVVVEHDDGAWSRVPEDATAFGHRTWWPYNLVVTTMWTDPLDSDANIQWTRAFWQALKPFLAEAARQLLGDLEDAGVRAAYGNKYDRLAALKEI
jgi:hypothetical protein